MERESRRVGANVSMFSFTSRVSKYESEDGPEKVNRDENKRDHLDRDSEGRDFEQFDKGRIRRLLKLASLADWCTQTECTPRHIHLASERGPPRL
ncbi:hypothetical protein EVAR_81784_1 [Eumeta japonica]|uniref:Uncharacterized protein n=1 Tax=Eumeta variegata TaxID=151549 RepID=A0A4C1UIB8_EUMVA|nr:hypothetical protein EVAR_81784_1 [Eumeta japonica]